MRGLHATTALVLVAALTLTAGCDGTPRASACGADGRGPVTFATVKEFNEGLRTFLQDRWRAGHPQEPLTIVALPASADEQRAQLAASMQTAARGGGGSYDVVGLDLVFIPEFASAGYLYRLDDRAFPRTDYITQSFDSSSYKGRLYAAPFTANVGLLYYWADQLFREGTVKRDADGNWRPKSWQDVRDAVQASGQSLPGVGYAAQLAQYEGLTVNTLELIWGFGGRLPDRGGTVDAVQHANGKDALEFMLRGVRAGWINKEDLGFHEDEAQLAFEKGQAVVLRHWPDAWAQLSAAAQNVEKGSTDRPTGTIGVAPLPGPGVLGGESVAVAACSAHRASAQDLVRFLTEDEVQRALFNQGLFLPTRTHLYRDGSLKGPEASPPPAGFVQLDSLNTAKPRPVVPDYLEASQQLQDEVHRQLESGRTDTAEAMFDRLYEIFRQA
jgi:multiple sugar transport system substrate-binding protein